MADAPIDVRQFAVEILENAHRALNRAVDGLSDEQIYQQPSPDTNSIGWLAWHLSRWKDRFPARVSGTPEVWVSEGWAERFGMDADATGLGDTPEQVAAFRPDRELLFGYVEAAHRWTVERVAAMTDEELVKPYQYAPSQEPRPAWRGLTGIIMDFTQHTGQIAYLRGLITGFGWRG